MILLLSRLLAHVGRCLERLTGEGLVGDVNFLEKSIYLLEGKF